MATRIVWNRYDRAGIVLYPVPCVCDRAVGVIDIIKRMYPDYEKKDREQSANWEGEEAAAHPCWAIGEISSQAIGNL